MNDREAQDIIRMIEGNWQMDLGSSRSLWRAELVQYDAELGTKAVTYLARKTSFKPRLADLTQTLQMFHRNLQSNDPSARKAIEEGRRGWATPEWVWIWKWARTTRDPRDERGFPQQQGHPDDTMTADQYAALREEWLAAGEPKESKILIGRSM